MILDPYLLKFKRWGQKCWPIFLMLIGSILTSHLIQPAEVWESLGTWFSGLVISGVLPVTEWYSLCFLCVGVSRMSFLWVLYPIINWSIRSFAFTLMEWRRCWLSGWENLCCCSIWLVSNKTSEQKPEESAFPIHFRSVFTWNNLLSLFHRY